MRFEATGGEGLSGLLLSLKQSCPEVRGTGDVVSARTAAQDTLTCAGGQHSGSPGELSFLSGQETGRFSTAEVKGAAHKQKGVV